MSISSILHNRVYIQTHCNDYRNPFQVFLHEFIYKY